MACPFRYDDDDASMENEDGAENSNPNISTVDDTTIRKRDRGLRGTAFRFSGICTEFTFSNSSLHDRIREFNRDVGHRFLACKGNHDPLKWISYVVLSYESSQLSLTIIRDLDRSARDKAAAARDARARNSRARAVDRSAASEETARDGDQTARKEEEAALERVR